DPEYYSPPATTAFTPGALDGYIFSTTSNHTCGSWLTLNAATGALSGTPDNSHVGSCMLAIQVTDSNSATSTETSTTITISNNAPAWSTDPAVGSPYSTIAEGIAGVAIDAIDIVASDEALGSAQYTL